jgi:hypothetical protein
VAQMAEAMSAEWVVAKRLGYDYKPGQSHDGSPKSWGGYFCTERTKATQCTPRWYVLRSTGKWEPQV